MNIVLTWKTEIRNAINRMRCLSAAYCTLGREFAASSAEEAQENLEWKLPLRDTDEDIPGMVSSAGVGSGTVMLDDLAERVPYYSAFFVDKAREQVNMLLLFRSELVARTTRSFPPQFVSRGGMLSKPLWSHKSDLRQRETAMRQDVFFPVF